MWLWVIALKEIALSTIFSSHYCIFPPKKSKEENHPGLYPPLFLIDRFFSDHKNLSVVLASSFSSVQKGKKTFTVPDSWGWDMGLWAPRIATVPLSWSSATLHHLSQWSEWAGWPRWGGHDTTSQEFWKALRTYPLPIGGGWEEGGRRVSNGNVTLCKRNSQSGTFQNIPGSGGALFLQLFHVNLLPGRLWCWSSVSIRMHDERAGPYQG